MFCIVASKVMKQDRPVTRHVIFPADFWQTLQISRISILKLILHGSGNNVDLYCYSEKLDTRHISSKDFGQPNISNLYLG